MLGMLAGDRCKVSSCMGGIVTCSIGQGCWLERLVRHCMLQLCLSGVLALVAKAPVQQVVQCERMVSQEQQQQQQSTVDCLCIFKHA